MGTVNSHICACWCWVPALGVGAGSGGWVGGPLGAWAPQDQHWDLSQLGICRQQLQFPVSSQALQVPDRDLQKLWGWEDEGEVAGIEPGVQAKEAALRVWEPRELGPPPPLLHTSRGSWVQLTVFTERHDVAGPVQNTWHKLCLYPRNNPLKHFFVFYR